MISAAHNPAFQHLIDRGVPVHSDPDCRSLKHSRTVTRTWRQRLFTRPWRPMWKSYLEGEPTAYVIEVPAMWPLTRPTTTVVAHPEIIEAWMEAQREQAN